MMHSHDGGSHRVNCDSYCFTGFRDTAGNRKTDRHTHRNRFGSLYIKICKVVSDFSNTNKKTTTTTNNNTKTKKQQQQDDAEEAKTRGRFGMHSLRYPIGWKSYPPLIVATHLYDWQLLRSNGTFFCTHLPSTSHSVGVIR